MPRDDDDEGDFGGEYENGHWAWDDTSNSLVFISDLPEDKMDAVMVQTVLPLKVEFIELDLIEQMRFRKRYQRKVKLGEPDVISVQDVKDLALYTAPITLLSPMLINLLHLPTFERFIRALIMYCQYYLQTAEEMAKRMVELETKVRTPICEKVEEIYRVNLCDLRSMVAKEYCTVLLGGDDMVPFHHMGPAKKRRSLSNKDARLFETLFRICIQIVWVALGRRSYNHLELEVNRVLKSETFNSVEHTLKTGYLTKLSPVERSVLLGHCVRQDAKLNTRSPLINEIFCERKIDFRAMGLGVIKYDDLTPRLRYLLMAVAGPEEHLLENGVTVGILGYPRTFFDTTLTALPTVIDAAKMSKSTNVGSSSLSVAKESSRPSSSKSVTAVKKTEKGAEKKYVYPDLVLPSKEESEPPFPSTFPEITQEARKVSEAAHRRWQSRLHKILHPSKSKRRSTVISCS